MNATSFESPARRSHVVCVNSSPDLLEMFCTLLEDEGYAATPLHHSVHLEKRVVALAPDALIIDLVPGLTESWELLERIHVNHLTSHIPRIVMSTDLNALAALQRDPERYGCIQVMAKPFDVCDLCETLRDILQIPVDEAV